MNHVLSILAILLCSLATNAFCAQGPKALKIKTMKTDLMVPFTDQTTIANVKEAIQASEGIPVKNQRLTTSAGWVFGLPPRRLIITLVDNQTCRNYDLQDQHVINFFLRMKSQAQIAAELQARKEAMSAVLPLPQPIVDLVAAHDTHNED